MVFAPGTNSGLLAVVVTVACCVRLATLNDSVPVPRTCPVVWLTNRTLPVGFGAVGPTLRPLTSTVKVTVCPTEADDWFWPGGNVVVPCARATVSVSEPELGPRLFAGSPEYEAVTVCGPPWNWA